MHLPDDLRTAIEYSVEGVPARTLAAAARDLSQRYRGEYGHAASPLLRSRGDVAAYAAYRLPATFAAVAAVLEETSDRQPDFNPESMLDVGGGPGTATWAALEIWPHIRRVTILERDRDMIELGEQLAREAESAAIRDARWRQADITAQWDAEPADLTVAAYMLGELPEESRPQFIRELWAHTTSTCALVEPGTPAGFAVIRAATQELTRLGAAIIAPFPAGWECIEGPDDWCHFSARVPRTRLHRAAKEGTLAHEDEKFSYVVASRLPALPVAARVIRHPQIRSGHIRLVLCTAAGVRHMVVTRKNREAFRRAKDLTWGSAIAPEEAALFALDSEPV